MRHLLTLNDLSFMETRQLCQAALLYKQSRYSRNISQFPLADTTTVLLFEKPSLRTRISFEIAAQELGGRSLYLSPQEVGLGKRESIADVAHVLSAYAQTVVIRTFSHTIIEEFAENASIPVINGLTDLSHPCQGLTDVFTIYEHFGPHRPITIAYIGDGNNVANSLLQTAAHMGMSIRLAVPSGFTPNQKALQNAEKAAIYTGADIHITDNPLEAAENADVVYTDVWVSMGQEQETKQRTQIFAQYQVNDTILRAAKPDAVIMHPLPAHRGFEITDNALDGAQSIVFTQAENRLHMQKAILALLAGDTYVFANKSLALAAE